jgi:hypothetical protein
LRVSIHQEQPVRWTLACGMVRLKVSPCFCLQVVKLKAAFQQHIREAEALKLELGRAEETLRAAAGAH